MRYGLLTIHNTQNYGSLLQTYSTYHALDSLGVQVDIIDYHNTSITQRERPITDRPVHSLKDLVKRIIWGTSQKEKYENIYQFLKKNTSLSRPYDISNIQNANDEYEVFVTGSDIVWGTKITGEDFTYFLDFVNDSKGKIAFSSSVGSRWTEEEKKKIKPLLTKFDTISVREQIAAEWVSELTGRKTPVTCDPTMLWEADFWEKFVLEDYAPIEKYVLIYAVNPDKKNITDGIEYAKNHGLRAYFINFYSPVKGTKKIHPVTVSQWITLIAKADVVFSASYHGLLFALYFKKPVFFYNRGEKSRMISLSQELRIEHREGLNENIRLGKAIDYNYVHQILKKKREYSWTILKEAIYEFTI